MSWMIFVSNQVATKEKREQRTRTEKFKRLLAALPKKGLCLAEAEVKGDWTEQNIFVGSGQLIGSVGFNSDKTQFTGIAYVKDANEPNALEALWLKLDVDPYQINAFSRPE
ncbi:MAG: hypothetical protein AAB410_02610 [Patescibacteria group bacterium]